jgi:beta-1,4-mannosyl-glycoprotein beta-1,4-N-acetylglucosaminyltransferase
MIVDAVLYNGEADLLRLRIDTLAGVVARFVVVEGAETFSGRRKMPGLLREPSLAPYLTRLVYVVASLLPDAPSAWHREAHQRNAILRGLVGVPDDALVLIGDVDEIPDPSNVGGEQGVYELSHRAYDARNVRQAPWRGTIAATAAEARRLGPEGVRRMRLTLPVIGGGWHFTHMGGVDRLRAKVQAFSHQEYNTPATLQLLEARRRQGVDPFGRGDEVYAFQPDAALPEPLARNPGAYPMLWRDAL